MSEQRVDSLETRIACLERQMRQQRVLTTNLSNWIDTKASSIFKRLWWVLCGYRFHRVGRWYGKDKDQGWPLPDKYKSQV